jgi:hypothetical protein
MRRPLKSDVNAPDEWYFRFKSHAPSENKVTIRVTEIERDGKLIVELDSVEGVVSVRGSCSWSSDTNEEVERLRAALRRCGSDAIGDNSTLAARIHMHVKNALEDES